MYEIVCFALCFQYLTISSIHTISTMDGGVTVVTKPFVNVRITSSISAFEVQRGFDRGITIAELKVGS